jgi:hypothetical protein
MKLLRYGEKGQERPGLLDDNGELRDLSAAWCRTLRPGLEPRQPGPSARLDPASAPRGPGRRAWVPASVKSANLSASASITPTMRPKPARRSRPSRWCSANGPARLSAPTTTSKSRVIRAKPTGKWSWAWSSARAAATSAKTMRWHVAGYCVINDVSEREFQLELRRHLGQGQRLRHLWPARPVAGDAR